MPSVRIEARRAAIRSAPGGKAGVTRLGSILGMCQNVADENHAKSTRKHRCSSPAREPLRNETAKSDPRSFHSTLSSGRHKRVEELAGRTSDYDLVCSHFGPLHDLLDVAPAECPVGTAQTLPRKAGKPPKSLRRYLRCLRMRSR